MIRKIFLGSFASVLYIFSVMSASIVQSALAIRYLPKIEAGIWFIFLNIVIFVSFCDFGLSPTLSREIGFSNKKRDASLRVSNLFITIRRLVYFISFLLIFVLALFAFFYFSRIIVNSHRMHVILIAFIIFAVGILARFQANPYLATIYGLGEVGTERVIRIIGPVSGVIICSFLVVSGYGLPGLAVGYVCQTVVVLVLSHYFFRRKVRLIKAGKFIKLIVARVFNPSMQWTVMNVGSLLIFQVGNFLIAAILGVQHVSQYAPILQILMAILMLASMVGLVITPFASRAYGTGDFVALQKFMSASARFSTAISVVLALFFIFFIHGVTRIWLGEGFAVNYQVVLILMLTAILESHHVACASVAMAAGYVRFGIISLISGVLCLVLSYVLISFVGVVGAALAILISQILTNNWYAVLVSLSHCNYRMSVYFKAVILRLLLFSLIFLVAMYLNSMLLMPLSDYYRVLIAIATTVIASVLIGWYILLDKKERLFIVGLFRPSSKSVVL